MVEEGDEVRCRNQFRGSAVAQVRDDEHPDLQHSRQSWRAARWSGDILKCRAKGFGDWLDEGKEDEAKEFIRIDLIAKYKMAPLIITGNLDWGGKDNATGFGYVTFEGSLSQEERSSSLLPFPNSNPSLCHTSMGQSPGVGWGQSGVKFSKISVEFLSSTFFNHISWVLKTSWILIHRNRIDGGLDF